MIENNTRNTRTILTGLNYSGLDRIYQQLDSELGMILTFHHVRPDLENKFSPNAHLSIEPEFLEKVIQLLSHRQIEVISLDEAVERISQPRSDGRFAVFTFDDGYRDTLECAAPIMRKFDLPYTVYIAPGFIEGSADLWWEGIEELVDKNEHIVLRDSGKNIELECTDLESKYRTYRYLLNYFIETTPELEQRQRARDLCSNYNIDLDARLKKEMMNWDEVRQIIQDPLCTVGAHTLNHMALARLNEKNAIDEMLSGANKLQHELGSAPRHMAYPYGYRAAAGSRDFALAKEAGFSSAVTTRPGMIFPQHKGHLTALPRISVNGLFQHRRYLAPLISGLPTRLSTRFKRIDVE